MVMIGIKTVFQYAWRSKKEMILTLIYMSIGTFSITIIPRFAEALINGIYTETTNSLIRLLFLGIGIGVIGSIIQGLGRYYSAEMGTMAQYEMRRDIYHSISNQNFKYFDMQSTGDLVSRATSDIETCTPIFNMGITVGIQAVITLIGVIIGIFLMMSTIAFVFLIVIIMFLFIVKYASKKMYPEFYESRKAFGRLTSTFRENLIGAQVVRIFNGKRKEQNKFALDNTLFKDKSIATIKWHIILRYSAQIIIGLLTILSLLIGGRLVIIGEMEIGTLIGFLSYIIILGMPLNMINMVVLNFVQAEAAMKRILEVLDHKSDAIIKQNPIELKEVKGKVEFKNVSFAYFKGKPVLKNINFKVDSGDSVAIVGTTGSGKSTLIKLIPRYYELPENNFTSDTPINKYKEGQIGGVILLDGINIQDYNLDHLRSHIGYCSQDIFLFDDTIADNIRFGRPTASMKEVIQAAKMANIHNFIQTLPNGYKTIVGERGTSLSGGQKQRIAIARALIMNPSVLILDAFTSAVDTETEYKIQKALDNVMEGRTSFLITQRVSNLRDADKIIVMDKGEIKSAGNHQELYSQDELYRSIYDTMFEKFKEAEYVMQQQQLTNEGEEN